MLLYLGDNVVMEVDKNLKHIFFHHALAVWLLVNSTDKIWTVSTECNFHLKKMFALLNLMDDKDSQYEDLTLDLQSVIDMNILNPEILNEYKDFITQSF